MFTRLLQLAGAQVIATDMLEPRLRLARKFGAKWVFNVGPASRLSPSSSIHFPKSELPCRAEVKRKRTLRLALPLSAPRRGEDGRRPGEVFFTFIHRATRGRGLDAAVIAVPSDAAVQQALQLIRCGGQILLFAHTRRIAQSAVQNRSRSHFSLQPSAFSLDLASICLDEKDLLGSYSSDFTLQDEVARLVFSRRLDVRDLISHFFPLEQTAAAIRLASQPTADSLKIIVEGTACHRP
jgi:L-iditol 2-dehydrogenase